VGNRILLAWELGSGQGHIFRLNSIAQTLRQRGWQPVFALQRLDGAAGEALGAEQSHQAPIWPGLTDEAAFRLPGRGVSLADNLGSVGMRSSDAVKHMLDEWDGLFALIRPDTVVADFAPACLVAARGRIPSVAVGNGFTLPPATLEHFPNLDPDGRAPYLDDAELCTAFNDTLKASDRRPLQFLPEIFSADRSCVATFTELDPYAGARRHAPSAPWVPEWNRSQSMQREELFVYLGAKQSIQPHVLSALARVAKSDVPVRVHIPHLEDEARDWLVENGLVYEPEPVPFDDIQARARMVLSLGSLGFVSCALAAGIPQIVVPTALAMELTGIAVERLKVARTFRVDPRNPLVPGLLGQAILEAFQNQDLSEMAQQLAPAFAHRLDERPSEIVADLVGELI
jgi:UDP:flavonoid glycosyltransferase YjiC (YdhE family)